jgi:hypothetical protein
VSFRINEPAAAGRYRFGLRTAEFVLCRHCGVDLAAVLTSSRGLFATINVNALPECLALADVDPVSYDDESVDERRQRRVRRWTPVVGTI